MNQNQVIKIAEHYGIDNQLEKLKEELLELVQAVESFQKEKAENVKESELSTWHIAEEIADCKIMMAQIVYLLECSDDMEEYERFKLNRQIERMEKGLE